MLFQVPSEDIHFASMAYCKPKTIFWNTYLAPVTFEPDKLEAWQSTQVSRLLEGGHSPSFPPRCGVLWWGLLYVHWEKTYKYKVIAVVTCSYMYVMVDLKKTKLWIICNELNKHHLLNTETLSSKYNVFQLATMNFSLFMRWNYFISLKHLSSKLENILAISLLMSG